MSSKRGRPKKDKSSLREKARLKYSLQKELQKEETNWKNIPENWFDFEGFVYLITNKISGKKYIGKKNFWEISKGKIMRESNWRFYKSSSIPLLNDIKILGTINFIFEILSVQRTKFDSYLVEIEEQFKHNVLRETLSTGEAAFYNDNIMSKFFRPKDFGTPEYIEKCKNISNALKEGFSSGRIIHPLKGKQHPNRGKQLPQTGHSKNKGKIWITNGNENRMIPVIGEIPEAFYPGFTIRNKKSSKEKKEKKSLTCPECNKQFIPKGTQKYCTEDCTYIAKKKRAVLRYKSKLMNG